MKRPKRPSTEPPRETFVLPPYAVALLSAWSIAVAFYFIRKAGVEVGAAGFENCFNRWLAAPLFAVPSAPALIRHVKRLAALAGMSLVFVSTGRRVLRAAAVAPADLWVELPLGFGLGYGIWGTMLFLAGLAGLWSRPLLLTALLGALAFAFREGWEACRRIKNSPPVRVGRPTVLDLCCIAGFLAVWLFVLGYALIPETFYDALEYHLALPASYLLNGRIFPTPENSYSGNPLLPSMLYGWTLAFDPWGITAGLLHSSVVLWIAAGCVGCCRKIGRASAGFLAAAAFFLVPVVIGESYRVSVNMEWALLELCCFVALVYALENERGSPHRRNWLLLAGTFLGFAMSTKYPAWLLPLALVPALVLDPSPSPGEPARGARLAVKEFAWILGVAALWLSPWILKNVWFYGNPLYPFFHEDIARSAEYMPNWRAISSAGTNLRELLGPPGLLSYVSFPFRFLAPPQGIQMSLGVFALGLLPVFFWARLSPRERLLGWFCAAAWIPLSLLSAETRFFIPHLAPLTILISCALVRVAPGYPRKTSLIVAGLLIFIAGFGCRVVSFFPAKQDAFLGRADYGRYLGHQSASYPAPPYSGIEYFNAHAPPDGKALLYGDARGFYFRRPFLAASADQAEPLEVWADESADGAALRRRFEREGIDYIVANFGEMSRQKIEPRASPRGFLSLNAFWNRYTARVFGVLEPNDRWVGVYRVLSESEAARPHSTDHMFQSYVDRQAAAAPPR